MLSGQRAEEYLQSDRIIISLHICKKFNEATSRSLAMMKSQAGRTVIQWPLPEFESSNWAFKYVG